VNSTARPVRWLASTATALVVQLPIACGKSREGGECVKIVLRWLVR
jgi:hypothetical protein